MNGNYSNYFNILKYIGQFKASDMTLEHLAEVEERFDKYLERVVSLGNEAMTYLTLELYNELLFSNQIEEQKILPPSDFINHNLISYGKYLTNKKVKKIQELLLENKEMPYPKGEYRNVEVFIKKAGEIVYFAPTYEAVPTFMQDFIAFFNQNSDNLDDDPFIKASLIHFLFIKIHPFVDGNGRVARVLHNLKFTNLINNIYNSNGNNLNLKVSPLNISYSIYNNKESYYQKLNNIIFERDADVNESINSWINFLLYMYEEQLNYNEQSRKLQNLGETLKRIRTH